MNCSLNMSKLLIGRYIGECSRERDFEFVKPSHMTPYGVLSMGPNVIMTPCLESSSSSTIVRAMPLEMLLVALSTWILHAFRFAQ